MKVRLDDAEWYPVVGFYLPEEITSPDLDEAMPVVDLPDDLYERVRAAEAEFLAAQRAVLDHLRGAGSLSAKQARVFGAARAS